MGGGNGAKSKQARERNAAKAAAAGKKTVGGPVKAAAEKCNFQLVKGSSGTGPCFKQFMTTQRPEYVRALLQLPAESETESNFYKAN
ncbi:hypothetical protein N0V93_001771 [Gnomoniopsis smithogilvyi]|uniref:Small EDRK-rich factor-like N-terminal domain-containing protein n=1 Tax=Gnomoniopsis smithogilvyi TaxID=1191159 RepID=A0A9W8Z4H7_9PEZI|nr:hypothetical protein N0V93_001771 [Gnomoniopsis smithogilvyi]